MVQLASDIISAAQATQVKYGVPASVTLAQYGLESSWGVHEPAGSNNPFGIKALPNQPSVTAMTTEVIKGEKVKIKQPFRKFASIAEAFDAHAILLSTKSIYAGAMAQWKAGNLQAGIRMMAAHYATAPTYASSLITLISANNLQQYDKLFPAAVPVEVQTVVVPGPSTPVTPSPPAGYDWIKVLLDAFLSLFARKV